METKQERLDKLYADMNKFKYSDLDDFEVNKKYGKLGGNGNVDSKIIFIAQNPSINRPQLKGLIDPGIFQRGTDNNDLFIEGLSVVGIKRNEVFVTNLVKASTPGNRIPTYEEVVAYYSILEREIEIIEPAVIVCLGNFVFDFLKRRKTSLRFLGVKNILKLHHPSYILRGGMTKESYLVEFDVLKKSLKDLNVVSKV